VEFFGCSPTYFFCLHSQLAISPSVLFSPPLLLSPIRRSPWNSSGQKCAVFLANSANDHVSLDSFSFSPLPVIYLGGMAPSAPTASPLPRGHTAVHIVDGWPLQSRFPLFFTFFPPVGSLPDGDKDYVPLSFRTVQTEIMIRPSCTFFSFSPLLF